MRFAGISSTEIMEVTRLNKAYLQACRTAGGIQKAFTDALGTEAARALRQISPDALTRAAEAPYFLFDLPELQLPEADEELQPELIKVASPADKSLTQLALGFALELDRRDPFALRLVSGSDSGWALALAELSHTEIRSYVDAKAIRLRPVHRHLPGFWADWFAAAISNDTNDQRDALCASGLHHLVQRVAVSSPRRLAALASKAPSSYWTK